MKYDIYFHNDFDGRASAAVMLNFLERRGDAIERYIPVEHGIPWIEKKLAPSPKRNPAIVVDFPYHPEAKFWFDHHETAFKKEEWRRKFRQTKPQSRTSSLRGRFHHWDPKAPSCCGQIVKALQKSFGYKPPRHIVELAKRLDITDSASYRSARQAIEKKEPAFQIEQFVDEMKGKDALVWLINALSKKPLAVVAKMPEIQRSTNAFRKRQKAILAFYRKELCIHGAFGFIDISRSGSESRFMPYYLYPSIRYALTLKKGNTENFRLSFSASSWRRKENKMHIGRFMRDNFGGGGHHDAGGAEFKSRALAEKAAEKIIGRFA